MSDEIQVEGEELPHLLLVDDDATFTRVMARAMSRRGFRVSTAGSAEEGLTIAQADLPDYAALDLKMDGDSGLVLLPKLLELGDPLAAQVDPGLVLEGRVGFDEQVVNRLVIGVELDLDDGKCRLDRLQDRAKAFLTLAQCGVLNTHAGQVEHRLAIARLRFFHTALRRADAHSA